MPESKPNPRQTLAVLFGASNFRRAPKLAQGRAFYNSAQDFLEYLTASDALSLPRENVNSLFDDTRSPSDQLQDIREFLDTRTAALKNDGAQSQDLIVYYVGHGLFSGAENNYCFAIRATDERSEGLTSIRASDLASTIKAYARFLRKFLILDCCFSAAAYKEFQSGPLTVARTKLLNELPSRGTTLLCSSSAQDPSLAPQGLSRTMFSDGLLKALRQGHPTLGPWLSLSELGDLVKANLRDSYPDNWVRPEVHSPDQREGDIAGVQLFPNPAWVARQVEEARQKAESERRAREEAEAREREETERKAREQAEQGRLVAEAEKARQQAEAWKREQAERQARERADAGRKAREQAELEQLKADAEKARKQAEAREREQAEREAQAKAAAERKAGEQAEQEQLRAEAERARQQAQVRKEADEQQGVTRAEGDNARPLVIDSQSSATSLKVAILRPRVLFTLMGLFIAILVVTLVYNRTEKTEPLATSVITPTPEARCGSGEARACFELGRSYANGTGVAKDESKAVELFKQACDGGNALGCNNLGVMYNNGEGVAQDQARAAQLYKQACDGGDARGCTNLGWMYDNGLGVAKDAAKAAQLYQKGCDGGSAIGCRNIGVDYEHGTGSVARDEARAAQLYQKACDGGDAVGCHNLGLMYGNGAGVAKDAAKAAQLFNEAKRLGYYIAP